MRIKASRAMLRLLAKVLSASYCSMFELYSSKRYKESSCCRVNVVMS